MLELVWKLVREFVRTASEGCCHSVGTHSELGWNGFVTFFETVLYLIRNYFVNGLKLLRDVFVTVWELVCHLFGTCSEFVQNFSIICSVPFRDLFGTCVSLGVPMLPFKHPLKPCIVP